jgi:hypothetical protein
MHRYIESERMRVIELAKKNPRSLKTIRAILFEEIGYACQ